MAFFQDASLWLGPRWLKIESELFKAPRPDKIAPQVTRAILCKEDIAPFDPFGFLPHGAEASSLEAHYSLAALEAEMASSRLRGADLVDQIAHNTKLQKHRWTELRSPDCD